MQGNKLNAQIRIFCPVGFCYLIMSLDGKLANEYEFSASLDLDQVEEFQSFEDWKIFFQEGESYRLQMDPKISEDPFFIVARLKEVKSYLTYLELHFVPLEPSEKFLLLLKDPQSKNPKTESSFRSYRYHN